MKKRLPNVDPNVTAEQWLEPLKLGSKSLFETCWYKDDDTLIYIRNIRIIARDQK